MESIEQELIIVAELNRVTRTADAENKLRRLIVKLPRHELILNEHQIRKTIDRFLPKKRKALTSSLEAALASRLAVPSSVPTLAHQPTNLRSDSRAIATAATSLPANEDDQRYGTARLPSLEEQTASMATLSSREGRTQSTDVLACIIASEAGLELEQRAGAFDQLLRAVHSVNQKRQILAFLAKAITGVAWLREEASVRLSIVRLMDEVWSNDVYPAIGVTSGMQTHEKWMRVEDAIGSLATQLKVLRSGFTSLTMFHSARQELKRALNSGIAKAIVWPLVSRELITLRVDEAFVLPQLKCDTPRSTLWSNGGSHESLEGSHPALAARVHARAEGHDFTSPFGRQSPSLRSV